jgi:superfamily I DNA/RNA helicase
VRDDAEMLRSLAEGADSVQHVIDRAESLFTDDGLGDKGVVTFSSVHKSKGLEADRVFVLASTLRDTNEEERNIAYVAITRAKQRLTWAVGS